MRKNIQLVLFFLIQLSTAHSQGPYTVRIMTWNLLNYPSQTNLTSDTTTRNPYYRTVIQYAQPDIIVTQENSGSNSVPLFLNSVMNATGLGTYSSGSFINGYDTDNAIYYRASDFQFLSNTPIQTDLRDINEFKLVHLATNDTIRIYSCHLKASSGFPNDNMRATEVDSLRKITNALNTGSDFIVCGDFNIYGDYEPAYVKLLQNNITDDGNFVDPYSMTGVWNQYGYRYYHTQSTRTRSFGGGATGGMNDRFDMILYSTAVSQPGRVTYIPGSMTPVGNDGLHYNDSINRIPNAAVSQTVANALHYSSDHLPVYAEFEFAGTTGIAEAFSANTNFRINPNPAISKIYIDCYLRASSEITVLIKDVLGKTISRSSEKEVQKGLYNKEIYVGFLKPGIYFISLQTNNGTFTAKLIII